MWVLGIETTTASGSVALARVAESGEVDTPHLTWVAPAGRLESRLRSPAADARSARGVSKLPRLELVAERALEARNYASSLFAMTEQILTDAGLVLGDVDLFAVADGPGSFTGERVGLTAVKGWMEALGKPAVTVSTLRAIGGPLALMDAGRGEVYYGRYPEGEEGLAPAERFVREDVRRQRGLLAGAVARLGLAEFRAGRTTGALEMDARYLQRPAISPISIP